MDERAIKELPILAVDDQEANLLLLRRILEREGYVNIETTTEPLRVPEMVLAAPPSLILLDLHMPGLDGFELMEQLGTILGEERRMPFLVLTADVNEETKRRALSVGARDFLTKPLDQTELLMRVRNLLQVQYLQTRLLTQNATLEGQVAERTRDLEQARLEVLDRLALAAEYRDDDTQQHAWRIGRTSALLAAALDLPEADVELIRRAAPLHDLGKIGIPDAILLKPERLSDGEFQLMKTHTTIGAEILSGSSSPLLLMAEQIALTHHERWDGHGYPNGLSGEQIPLPGRIVAVADVADALAHARPYKDAWRVERVVAEILNQAGSQFDPAVVEAFAGLDHQKIFGAARDAEQPARPSVARTEKRLATYV